MKVIGCYLLFIYFILCFSCCAFGDLTVYDGMAGDLAAGWQSWSWATVNFQETGVVPPNYKYSISMVCNNWEALYLHPAAFFTVADYTTMNFLINGGTNGNEPVSVIILSNGTQVGKVDVGGLIGGIPANKWAQVNIPLSDFGVPATTIIDGIWWEAESGSNSGTIYLDNIVLISAPPPPVTAVFISVNDTAQVPVSNLIFGVNWANSTQLATNSYTVNRWGGDSVTRYAYDIDASNHAGDWYFEDIANNDANPGELPFNSSADMFIQTTLQNGVVPIITTPLIGYTPIDRQLRCGFSVAKYGPQQETDPWHSDCGNGIKPDGKTPIVGNDPSDTSRVINETFVLDWLNHIDQSAGKGKVNFFELDNEPGLWSSVHRDVHPIPLTYDELWNRTVQYASAIKSAYPNAKIFGPIPWGWCEYMFSPSDNCAIGPDRKAHENLPLLEWYIQQLGFYKQQHGVQLVDVIDVHMYPQAQNVWSGEEDDDTVALRFRSTRSFWDPSYIDESWIAEPIYLIPRIQSYIDNFNPGLQIAVSEYDWGYDDIITGALAQVMILGIFAKNDVYLASRWVVPTLGSKTEEAFRLYTNYDGKGSSVHGYSIDTFSNNTDEAEAYAFQNGSQYFIVLINKLNAPLPVTLQVLPVSQAKVSLYSFSAVKSLGFEGYNTISNNVLQLTVDPWSATLIVTN